MALSSRWGVAGSANVKLLHPRTARIWVDVNEVERRRFPFAWQVKISCRDLCLRTVGRSRRGNTCSRLLFLLTGWLRNAMRYDVAVRPTVEAHVPAASTVLGVNAPAPCCPTRGLLEKMLVACKSYVILVETHLLFPRRLPAAILALLAEASAAKRVAPMGIRSRGGGEYAQLIDRIERLEADVQELRAFFGGPRSGLFLPSQARTLSAASAWKNDGEQCTCGMDE